ncbi:hypothetical protein NQZ68_029815, partial [Dissostichus eleginoides]
MLAQATGEVDGEESWRVFTPKRASRGTAAGAVFWWLRNNRPRLTPVKNPQCPLHFQRKGQRNSKTCWTPE